jgi:hypothetical protein
LSGLSGSWPTFTTSTAAKRDQVPQTAVRGTGPATRLRGDPVPKGRPGALSLHRGGPKRVISAGYLSRPRAGTTPLNSELPR